MHAQRFSSIANKINRTEMKKKQKKQKKQKTKPRKLAQWWQGMRSWMQETRMRAKERYETWHQRQVNYDELPAEEQGASRKAERITMFTAIRILLAELGETEYWRTIWHLVWRSGYVIADYINGKRRQYLHPFQLLLATTVLLGLAVYIVPAKAVHQAGLCRRLHSARMRSRML